jgi:2-keto-3-deoxy-6-phosphogluconate aldolase
LEGIVSSIFKWLKVFDNRISTVPGGISATEINTARTFGAEIFKESVVQVLLSRGKKGINNSEWF